jgi:RHS repeat-associated protein
VHLAPDQTAEIYYIMTDHSNRPFIVANAAGVAIWASQADAFGVGAPNENYDQDGINLTLNLRFPGQYFDAESGLHYNLNRYYDPTTGRYLESDPIGLKGGLNTYAYVGGNPVNFVDPEGLDITVNLYPGAGGFGHVGVGVNSNQTYGFYPSDNTSRAQTLIGNPVQGVMKPDTSIPKRTIKIPTTPEQDQAIQDFIDRRIQNPGSYDLYDRNCATIAIDALGSGGVYTPDAILPEALMNNLESYGKVAQ